ncbi:MAG: hypothetical protein HYR56_20750 [Acidobacteria bacterium]|nr:hypothetical protein [Acidobacteriota bacterium]MBI3425911.1 hypothetical protein [Acidobacteriota bacterium]
MLNNNASDRIEKQKLPRRQPVTGDHQDMLAVARRAMTNNVQGWHKQEKEKS